MKKLKFIAVMMILVLLLCSCGANKNTEVDLEGDDLTPTSSLTIDEEEAAVLNEKVPVILYFSDGEQTKLVKEIRYVDIKEAKKGAETLASVMVRELIAGPKAEKLKALIPAEATLRSPVKIQDRVATVDFTKEFVDKHPGGKELAELTLFSIVNTLTELKDVERVKFTIGGKETKKFKDKVTLDTDYPRNDAVVNKEVGLALPEAAGLAPVIENEDADAAQILDEYADDPLE